MKKVALLLFYIFLVVDICFSQSIRKDYREMTDDEKEAYVAALYQLRTGLIATLANYHDTNFNSIHFNPLAAVQELQARVELLEIELENKCEFNK